MKERKGMVSVKLEAIYQAELLASSLVFHYSQKRGLKRNRNINQKTRRVRNVGAINNCNTRGNFLDVYR